MFTSRLSRRLIGQTPVTNRLSVLKIQVLKPGIDPALLELPQHLELMAARMQNGENIYNVFVRQAKGQGKFAEGLKRVAMRLQLGESVEVALSELSIEQKSPLVDELVNKLVLGMKRGTPMASQIQLMAAGARAQLKVAQLRAAGKNELKMLVPLVFLILPVTIAFAVFPSLQLLQLGF